MKTLFLLIIVFLTGTVFTQTLNQFPLIPLPNSIKIKPGVFKLSAKTKVYSNTVGLAKEMTLFNAFLKTNSNFSLMPVNQEPSENCIVLQKFSANKADSVNFHEHYQLEIRETKITIKGDSTGIFYALQTLKQLIGTTASTQIEIPCMNISDAPRFQWRGMHLDVCRHFFPKEFIKKYIDLLAFYKLNTFHWHLTEDQGWRIEIKKYPKLTSIGAWRKGSMLGNYSEHRYDSTRYGGFYTQEDIKEIVAYAQQRHITIVPEIEMPGHSVAAIASYPFLSCNGKQLEVEKTWGVFDDVYCSKDSVFTFLQDVLDEVMSLFPGKYIHIGGDECPKTRWKTCVHCQARIKAEHLKDEHELQSYFIKRIESYLNLKGRQIIGWDEILEGGLAPNAAVMSWRGIEGGISAAKQHHKVVMSPGKPCYFDHYQTPNNKQEPLAIGGFNPLDSVYSYEPMPSKLLAEESPFILGAQANVWTEYILNEAHVEQMALPRMCALAEVLWTNKEHKNYQDFLKRLRLNVKILDKMKVNYTPYFLSAN